MIDERLESGRTAADKPGVDLKDPAQEVRTLHTFSPLPGEKENKNTGSSHPERHLAGGPLFVDRIKELVGQETVTYGSNDKGAKAQVIIMPDMIGGRESMVAF